MLSKDKIQKVLKILEKEYGGTGTALNFKTPFQLLVATMMAAQSTDKQVNKITEHLFKEYPDAQAFARLAPEELEEKIKKWVCSAAKPAILWPPRGKSSVTTAARSPEPVRN